MKSKPAAGNEAGADVFREHCSRTRQRRRPFPFPVRGAKETAGARERCYNSSVFLSRAHRCLPRDPIPSVADRALHMLPCRLTAVLVSIPVTLQVRLDLVPLTPLVPLRRFETVPVARAIVVVIPIRGRSVGPVAIVGFP